MHNQFTFADTACLMVGTHSVLELNQLPLYYLSVSDFIRLALFVIHVKLS